VKAEGSITSDTEATVSMSATVMLHRCCIRLSLLFENLPKPIPIKTIPKTTNIKVRVVWETTTGVPAWRVITLSKNSRANKSTN
jgi:hypothetical protein